MRQIRLAVAALWAGSLGGGALAAWQFFATLERSIAGAAVTSLFHTEAWIAVACAAVLLLARPGRALGWMVVAALACALTIRLGLMPMMDALKATIPPGGSLDASLRTQFGLLHLASTFFFAAEAVIAFLIVRRT
ncbi:MAG: DUF4149 domain-containing protein [Telluria sp.]